MISSMTGFGEASAEVDGIIYTVEIKSVNNRYLKNNLRLYDIISFCEEDVEKLIRRSLHRGTINCSIRLHNVSGQTLFDVDKHSLKTYVTKLREMAEENHIDNYQVDLANLLSLPGSIVPIEPDQKTAEKMKETVLSLVQKSLDGLKASRRQEGESIVKDLLDNKETISERLTRIKEKTPSVLKVYHEKLQKRVEELLSEAQLEIDRDTLAREVAVFAERSDIAEELSRLDAHLNQFDECCTNGSNAGRRLDFISQEMLREANTIGSKASDSEISRLVIDIKCAIDRIKEQVQNVE